MKALMQFLRFVGLLKKEAPDIADQFIADLERENQRLEAMSDAIMGQIERTTLEAFSSK